SFHTMGELPVLSLRTQESTRNCLHVWSSRRNGKLYSIAVTVPHHNLPPQFIERDWTKLRQSTGTLMEDSRVEALSPRGKACRLLAVWLSRLILMPGSRLMATRTECTLWMRREIVRCKIGYSHLTSPFWQNARSVPSWSRSMHLWSWMR